MSERYWLVQPNGAKQLIDARDFDIARLAEHLRRVGGEIVVESSPGASSETTAGTVDLDAQNLHVAGGTLCTPTSGGLFEPPVSALSSLFRRRLEQIHACLVPFSIEMNTRPTARVLGGYYRKRQLVRIYTHDRSTGRRPLAELFDTFLHEVAHHLEYTEPQSFSNRGCGRVRGRMHSPLFWLILGTLRERWADSRRPEPLG